MKIFFVIFGFCFLSFTFKALSFQDTLVRRVSSDSSVFFLQDKRLKYLNPSSPDTISRKRILWYPIKTFEDLLNYLPGYYLKFSDVGQLNLYSFNQAGNMIFFKHGRPFDYDLNFLSRNEIDEIEIDRGYGNNQYQHYGFLNVIQRQIFRSRPFTEINFYQDRYENLFIDASYHQNIFKNFNLNFGLTKHSYEGHYVNSEFDKWLGRVNLNYAPSRKVSLFSYFNYGIIERGLNGGINSLLVDISDKESMFNRTKAVVNNPYANEKKQRFDIDFGADFRWNRDQISRIHIYAVSNPLDYSDSTFTFNVRNQGGGIKLQHVFDLRLSDRLNISSRSEAGYETRKITDIHGSVFSKSFNYAENIAFSFNNNTISFYLNGTTGGKDVMHHAAGFRGVTKYELDGSDKFIVDFLYTTMWNYTSGRISFETRAGNLSAEIYRSGKGSHKGGINLLAEIYVFKIKIISNYTYLYKKGEDITLPKSYGVLNLSYLDVAFRNKFEYRIGSQSRFWSSYTQNLFVSDSLRTINVPANFTLDVYLKVRIGRVYAGLVFENIFNRLIYNSAVYPFMDRGGLFNVLSRFDITWNFFD